jgi:membrane protein
MSGVLAKPASRLENLLSWFAASVVVTAGVIWAARRSVDESRAKPGFAISGPAQEPLALQQARAEQRGRGRDARGPLRIPWRGWNDILVRTWRKIEDDRLLALAAGVVFYSLLALFPGLAAGVSCYALFADAGTIAGHLSIMADIVPAGVLDILRGEIARIAAKGSQLTLGFLVGLGLALWSANTGMKAVIDALNIIYEEQERRGIVRLNVVSLFFTACTIGAAVLAVAAVVVFPLVVAMVGLRSPAEALIGHMRWPGMFVLIICGLAVLYRYGPYRSRARWRWLSVGSVLAASTWLAVSSLFSWYLGNFANYDATYGTLGAVVGLMMWMWLSTIVVLVGAELNAEIEHQTARDSTVGAEKPLGARGAVMADTVGAAQA